MVRSIVRVPLPVSHKSDKPFRSKAGSSWDQSRTEMGSVIHAIELLVASLHISYLCTIILLLHTSP